MEGRTVRKHLTPFLQQDSGFPHVLPAKTGVPKQVFELMLTIRAELPGSSMRGRLAIKTYLKMILMLLVNQYSSDAGTVEAFRRQQCALDHLHNFFDFLRKQIGEAIQVPDAARLCGLTESDFMYFFGQVIGRSFRSYLNHCRVERAQVLLANTNLRIAAHCAGNGLLRPKLFQCGFSQAVRNDPGSVPAPSS